MAFSGKASVAGSATPRTALKDWAAVPNRAWSDRRLKERHYAVLGVICSAVDTETGVALISQSRIAKRTGRPRTKIGEIVRDLEGLGYVRPMPRGRQKSGLGKGRFRTLAYEVLYQSLANKQGSKPDSRVTPQGGDMDRVTPQGGDNAVLPPRGVTDSNLYRSDIPTCSYPLGASARSTSPEGSARSGTLAQQGQGVSQATQARRKRPRMPQRLEGGKTEALKRIEDFELGCEEVERLDIDRAVYARLKKAHDRAARLATPDRLTNIALEARRRHTSPAAQITYMIDQYEALKAEASE